MATNEPATLAFCEWSHRMRIGRTYDGKDVWVSMDKLKTRYHTHESEGGADYMITEIDIDLNTLWMLPPKMKFWKMFLEVEYTKKWDRMSMKELKELQKAPGMKPSDIEVMEPIPRSGNWVMQGESGKQMDSQVKQAIEGMAKEVKEIKKGMDKEVKEIKKEVEELKEKNGKHEIKEKFDEKHSGSATASGVTKPTTAVSSDDSKPATQVSAQPPRRPQYSRGTGIRAVFKNQMSPIPQPPRAGQVIQPSANATNLAPKQRIAHTETSYPTSLSTDTKPSVMKTLKRTSLQAHGEHKGSEDATKRARMETGTSMTKPAKDIDFLADLDSFPDWSSINLNSIRLID
ncbi:hypothetical protein CC80DRAFT_549215 [Byssothecium circinans]|uniref:Uncharacterized protein n=1 Tax=Byssothecium circinans TaxID=147558 RepID=A0A6A5U2Z9_9PLEO|nr:hypothetical protein CC80DRAFT_549215 [Byssothecium circinans]